ncbi:sigma-70 family RNA polymerase sigma factor [Candidatus Poribacteria bacterium]|nr:sigma-70 family RNA polymerase sigma factor [Candidatus Poribacteria bacterium]MYI93600.1 sigma-70 family RNA polymerase sigma factor [Candidatus Poribacteria bacterium]
MTITIAADMETYSEIVQVEEFDTEQERELILRCQEKDPAAMGTLIVQYQHWVYNIAYGLLGHREDAQDTTQDVFLSVWQNIHKFQFRSRFSTWLYKIVKNKCLNVIDQKKRRKTDPMEIDDTQPWVPLNTVTPEQEVLRNEQAEILHAALGKLKESYRTILVLRELRELSYEEIAEILNCTLGRVKSRLHEARKALRQELERIDW